MDTEEQGRCRSLEEALRAIYRIQMCHFYPYEVVSQIMEELNLSEEDIIRMIRALIRKGWLSTRGFFAEFFLRPGYISSFPVIISAAGLKRIKEG